MSRRTTVLALTSAGALALATGCTQPQTVEQVDLGRYVGRWYQTAAYPQPYEAGLVGITADYARRPDGSVSVLNKGFQGTCSGPVSSITGVATVVDTKTNAKLAVRFDTVPITQVFPGEYWIIDLDRQDYGWAVVADSSRTSLFLLSRTPRLDPAIDAGIRQRLAANGFDLTRLVDTVPCE